MAPRFGNEWVETEVSHILGVVVLRKQWALEVREEDNSMLCLQLELHLLNMEHLVVDRNLGSGRNHELV